jgi:hypothetical protein
MKNNGKVELDEVTSMQLWNGIKVAEVLAKIEST